MMKRLLDDQKNEINSSIQSLREEVSGRLVHDEAGLISNEQAIEKNAKYEVSKLMNCAKVFLSSKLSSILRPMAHRLTGRDPNAIQRNRLV
eukprot:3958583-Karenia_brevis.AAC.1